MDDTVGHFVTAENEQQLKEIARDIFKAEERIKAMDGVFVVGETLSVRGSRFKVESITEDGQLTLLLLPRAQP